MYYTQLLHLNSHHKSWPTRIGMGVYVKMNARGCLDQRRPHWSQEGLPKGGQEIQWVYYNTYIDHPCLHFVHLCDVNLTMHTKFLCP